MRIDIVTIFPAMVEQALTAGIIGRAIERGTLELRIHDHVVIGRGRFVSLAERGII